MNDLITFLNARLGEDEAAARESYYEGQRWLTEEEGVYRWPDDELVHMADRKADARHVARHDPASVLRDVEADRKLLAALEQARKYSDRVFGPVPPDDITPGEWLGERMRATTQVLTLERVVRIRAERFSDHPDYQPGVGHVSSGTRGMTDYHRKPLLTARVPRESLDWARSEAERRGQPFGDFMDALITTERHRVASHVDNLAPVLAAEDEPGDRSPLSASEGGNDEHRTRHALNCKCGTCKPRTNGGQ